MVYLWYSSWRHTFLSCIQVSNLSAANCSCGSARPCSFRLRMLPESPDAATATSTTRLSSCDIVSRTELTRRRGDVRDIADRLHLGRGRSGGLAIAGRGLGWSGIGSRWSGGTSRRSSRGSSSLQELVLRRQSECTWLEELVPTNLILRSTRSIDIDRARG